MIIRIISWNVRGSNEKEKRKVIKAFLRPQRADVICLEETKIQEMTQNLARSLGVGRFLGWGAINARGASRGIVVLRDTRVVHLIGMEEGQFIVSCLFKNCENGSQWTFIGVYGPCSKREREGLWEELGSIQGMLGGP